MARFTDDYSPEISENDVHCKWDSTTKSKLSDITYNCMDETGLYVRGFIEEL